MKRHLLIVLGLAVFTPVPGWAHDLGVECKLREGKVQVYVYYDDDTDAVEAVVQVLEGEMEIAMGKTDAKGMWSFPVPPPGKYQVMIRGGGGHRTKANMTIPAAGLSEIKVEKTLPSKEPHTHDLPGDKKSGKEALPKKKESADTEGTKISDGRSRESATRYPWLKVGMGLGIIGLVALAFLFSRGRANRNP